MSNAKMPTATCENNHTVSVSYAGTSLPRHCPACIHGEPCGALLDPPTKSLTPSTRSNGGDISH